jgi:hypothetical protein
MTDQNESPVPREELASIYAQAKRAGNIKERWEYVFWCGLSFMALIPFIVAFISGSIDSIRGADLQSN